MRQSNFADLLTLLLITALAGIAGCAGGIAIPDIGGILDMNGNDNGNDSDNGNNDDPPMPDPVSLTIVAENTNGASGLAIRPSDGALFTVNADGLLGPLDQDDANWPVDASTLSPLGATNLSDPDIFMNETSSLVMAITNGGEFWIGTGGGNFTLAIVPPEGGDAEQFLDQSNQGTTTGISPETMVIVRDTFTGPQMQPGNLLLGAQTTFSRLSAINVEGDRAVIQVDNPIHAPADPTMALNRDAHHLAFGPDGTLYSSQDATSLLEPGFQTIAADGTPSLIPGTEGIAGTTFVILDNGDILFRGSFQQSAAMSVNGIFIFSPADQSITLGTMLPSTDVSSDDEMVMTADGTIYLSLPRRNQIVRVDIDEQ